MKWMLTGGLWFLLQTACVARLGDTREQAEDRYGPPDKTKNANGNTPLLEGSREWMFEYKGWRIVCAMLVATDGREYVVRERYSKIWNTEVMQAGGTPTIRDYEEQIILEAEGGAKNWTKRTFHDGQGALPHDVEGFVRGLLGPAWLRKNGAVARKDSMSMVLDLPHARMHEAQLKAIKERKQRKKANELLGSIDSSERLSVQQ